MSKNNLENKIDRLTSAVEKLVLIPPITPVAPIAPNPPIPAHTLADHDLLQRVDTKVDGLIKDIKEIKDGTTTQLSDHETRLRSIEKSQESQSGTMSLTNKIVFGACAIVLTAVLSGLIFLVIRK